MPALKVVHSGSGLLFQNLDEEGKENLDTILVFKTSKEAITDKNVHKVISIHKLQGQNIMLNLLHQIE